MSQDFDTVESCNCEDNQVEERRVLQIEAGANADELQVTELRGPMREGPELVSKGQSTARFGRSFDELLSLGPGLHNICNCRTIARKDAVFRPKQE